MDQLRLALAAPEAPARHSARRARNQVAPSQNVGAYYEAGAMTRRTVSWRAPSTTANSGVLANLTTIRNRSRAAVRNDGFAKAAIDRLVTNIIGTGIQPMSMADDPEFRTRIQALWLRWTDEADADGQFDFYGLQALAVRGWLEGGETFTRLRLREATDGLSVPLQLQVLEPELCPHTYHDSARRIRAGIEFNAIGRRTAYYFYPTRPELDDFDQSRLRRVPASSVCHLYLPLRAGQLRGLPLLTAALITLYELDKFADATLLRQQLANLFVAFIRRPQGISTAEEVHPMTGTEPETVDDKPILQFEPGIMQELDPGEEMQFSEPPAPTGFGEFMRQELMNIAVAAEVPYEVLTGDMRGVNDRTVRVILHEFRRRVTMLQHQVVAFKFCHPIWRAFMDRVFLSGALPMPIEYVENPEPWLRVKWVPQGWPYINPVQDVAANKDAVRSGFKSRSSVISELGEDADVVDAEIAADNARADRLGLVLDTDPRKVSNAGLTQARPAGSEYPDDNTGGAE